MNELKKCLKINMLYSIRSRAIWTLVIIANPVIYILYNVIFYSYDDETWWFAYALYLIFLTMGIPITMYRLVSDKNRNLIKNLIYPNLSDIKQYDYSIVFTYYLIFFIPFLMSSAILGFINTFLNIMGHEAERLIYLSVATAFILVYCICLFMGLLIITNKFYLGFIIYIIINFYFIGMAQNVFWALFFPINYSERMMIDYYWGKFFLSGISFLIMFLCIKIKSKLRP